MCTCCSSDDKQRQDMTRQIDDVWKVRVLSEWMCQNEKHEGTARSTWEGPCHAVQTCVV